MNGTLFLAHSPFSTIADAKLHPRGGAGNRLCMLTCLLGLSGLIFLIRLAQVLWQRLKWWGIKRSNSRSGILLGEHHSLTRTLLLLTCAVPMALARSPTLTHTRAYAHKFCLSHTLTHTLSLSRSLRLSLSRTNNFFNPFHLPTQPRQEKYRSLAPMYYRGAAAAILVYDM